MGPAFAALLSERDCVITFARLLHDAGIPWDAIHHELSISRWMFEEPHPAATVMTPAQQRRRVDLALVSIEDLSTADLPADDPRFQLDAFLEFAYLSDFWTVPGASKYGAPKKGRVKVEEDVAKINLHLETGACRVGYVIVFEECDWGFDEDFAATAETTAGCRVRFIKRY